MRSRGGRLAGQVRIHPAGVVLLAALLSVGLAGCAAPRRPIPPAAPAARSSLPAEAFTRVPESPHDPSALAFTFDQLAYYYRVPGEFTHRLTGDEYGFAGLSFIITDTHPGGGPGLHVHDVEEAHVLLEGTARYVVGDETFTVQAPYVAKVPAGVPHTFINAGTEPFNLVAVLASKHPSTRRVGPNPLIPKHDSREGARSSVVPLAADPPGPASGR
jgi:mannose-6-phosphate isomerase-like protein (cupin superfamily)